MPLSYLWSDIVSMPCPTHIFVSISAPNKKLHVIKLNFWQANNKDKDQPTYSRSIGVPVSLLPPSLAGIRVKLAICQISIF